LRNHCEFVKFSPFSHFALLKEINVMYIRFTIKEIHCRSHKPIGVFSAAYDLLDSNSLDLQEEKQLREIMNWFEDNLPAPAHNSLTNRAADIR